MVLVNDAHDDMDSQWLITYHPWVNHFSSLDKWDVLVMHRSE